MEAFGWTDGSNGRTNGPAGAAAYVIATPDGEVVAEHVEKFVHPSDAKWTNNDMEMAAISLCIKRALQEGVTDFVVHSDSEWCVRILLEEYRLKQQKFRTLIDEIWEDAASFAAVEIRHIRREENKRADWLCSVATEQKRATKRAPQVQLPRV